MHSILVVQKINDSLTWKVKILQKLAIFKQNMLCVYSKKLSLKKFTMFQLFSAKISLLAEVFLFLAHKNTALKSILWQKVIKLNANFSLFLITSLQSLKNNCFFIDITTWI